jgi:hypothetical protein
MKKTHRGSCHCGAIRFECDLDLAAGTHRCNCSFCKKARMWFALVKEGDMRLLQGKELLTDYRHTPKLMAAPFLHLTFCSRCGVRPFSSGGVLPQLGTPFFAVNVACLDDATDEELCAAPIMRADGRNDDWQNEAKDSQYL